MSNRPSKKPLPSQRVNAARDQAQRSRTIWIVAAVAAVVVFALVVTLALSSGGDDGTATAGQDKGAAGTVVPTGDVIYGTVSVEGTPIPALTPGSADTAIGGVVPTVTGQQFDGSPITIGGAASNGKPTVVFGLAHWCPHCQKEVPFISSWLDDNGMPEDVNLVALSTGAMESRGNWTPDEWLIEEGWTIPTMADDETGTAAQAIGLSSFPYYLVYDADGKVIWRGSGERLTDAQWEPVLEAARTGVPPTS